MTLKEARQIVKESRRIVGFTGAGISTESGIPDFRSPGGVWSSNRTIEYSEFVRHRESRIEYWRQKVAMWPQMRDAQPNPGHFAFAELERRGQLRALITQNIDGLHQKAGSTRVLELHGTTTEVECLTCQARISMDEAVERIAAGEVAPECDHCGGDLKPATIMFGQAMPQITLQTAVTACQECDLLIAVGSSLVVYPAAALPEMAREAGAPLFIINRTPTPLDTMASLVLHEEIGQALPKLIGAA